MKHIHIKALTARCMDFKPKKGKKYNERHSEAHTAPGETICCLAGWSRDSHVPTGPWMTTRTTHVFLVRFQCQQLVSFSPQKISPVGLPGEIPRLNSKPGFNLERGTGLDLPSKDAGRIHGVRLRSPGYYCTLFERDKKGFIPLA